MKFTFGLQHPLTCKPSTTLSNPCNKERGEYVSKEAFMRFPSCVLSSCVFLHASFIPASSLMPRLSLCQYLSRIYTYATLKPDCHNWWFSKIQSETLEERYAVKFCFKLGKNATETYGMLQTAFQASCMNRASVFQWHKRFKEGRESVRDDESCGRSKEVNTPQLIGQRVKVTMLRF